MCKWRLHSYNWMQFDKNLLFLENENFKSKNSNNGGENPPVSRLILPQLRGDEIQIEKRGDRRETFTILSIFTALVWWSIIRSTPVLWRYASWRRLENLWQSVTGRKRQKKEQKFSIGYYQLVSNVYPIFGTFPVAPCREIFSRPDVLFLNFFSITFLIFFCNLLVMWNEIQHHA